MVLIKTIINYTIYVVKLLINIYVVKLKPNGVWMMTDACVAQINLFFTSKLCTRFISPLLGPSWSTPRRRPCLFSAGICASTPGNLCVVRGYHDPARHSVVITINFGVNTDV